MFHKLRLIQSTDNLSSSFLCSPLQINNYLIILTLARQKHQLSDFRTKSDHSSFPRDHIFSGPPPLLVSNLTLFLDVKFRFSWLD